jgi:iron complex outermembrane recepter protein
MFAACLVACGPTARLWAQASPKVIDLDQASLEDLMDIKVTSVSKKEEKLSKTKAAIFVISSEDIRRSGATNIPDLLRMAPGVDVEQINANSWAISIRGFNSRYSDKVLVLIDGRTVYSPYFSGVFWDQLEMPLEDIDRIEVIRGPGGTVWGANAMNGVINIITKSSKDTKGGLVTAEGGSQAKAAGEAQYGGQAGPNATYRIFESYFDIGNSDAPPGGLADDHWQRSHAGFRTDWTNSGRDTVMTEGDLYANQENQSTVSFIAGPSADGTAQSVAAAGGNLSAVWDHTLAGGSQTSLQGYFQDYRRTDFGTPAAVRTFDVDFQHHLTAGDRNDIVWGFGYRSDNLATGVGYLVATTPPVQSLNLFNVFLEDDVRITDALSLTLGAKLEHHTYTGLENEPSIRLLWSPPASRYSIWAAASRAIREPSRIEEGMRVDAATFPISATSEEEILSLGNPNNRAERLTDYELGYRMELTKTLSFDAATFLSFYRDLSTITFEAPIVVPGSPLLIEAPELYTNNGHALDYGGELSVNYKVTSFWRVSPGYSYLHATLWEPPGDTDRIVVAIATDFPQNMFQIRSQLNLSGKTEFDQSLYYTARLPGGSIPGYARLDVRVGRRFGEMTDISLVGQNLLQSHVFEYGGSYGLQGMESVRSTYAKLTFRF